MTSLRATFCFILITSLTHAAPTEVHINLLHDPRLPSLTQAQLKTTFDIARAMLRNAYDQDVSFTITAHHNLKDFLASEQKRLAPYQLPRKNYYDIYNDDIQRFQQHILFQCRRYGPIDQIKLLLEPAERESVTTHVQAAKLLTDRFLQRLDGFQKLKTPDGQLLLRPEDWRDYALGDWDIYLWSYPAREQIEVYFANIPLIESVLYTAPHSLINGLANGLTSPVTRTAIVAYYPILSDDPAIIPHRFGQLSENEKLTLVAHVLAHEVTHMLLHYADDYSPNSRPARPLAAFSEKSDLLSYPTWKPPAIPPKLLDMKSLRLGHINLRIDIAIAKKDLKTATEELFAAQDLNVPPEDLARLEARIARAFSDP